MNRDGTLTTGEIIGGCYRIDKLVASGGMGSVYRVHHLTLNRDLALKTLKTSRISRDAWTAFVTEAKVLSRLDHPNLVKVYDLGLIDSKLPYFIMDYIEGEPLSSTIKRDGALPVDICLAIFEQVADGLAYAEQLNLLHRDIKPGNIMLSAGAANNAPQVKIVDFGLATQASNSGAAEVSEKICGSPPYMSPEQSLYQNLDSRSDMYSTGCSFFEALTGAPPFIGESTLITLSKHQTEKPPSLKEASLGTDYPPVLEHLLARMLAKSPDDRIQTFAELKTILSRLRKMDPERRAKISLDQGPQPSISEQSDSDADPKDIKSPVKLIAIATTAAIVCAASIFALLISQGLSSTKDKAGKPGNGSITTSIATGTAGSTNTSNGGTGDSGQQSPSNHLVPLPTDSADEALAEEKLIGDKTTMLLSYYYDHFPFSTIKENSGKKERILNFPRTISVGMVGCVAPDRSITDLQPARGSMVVSPDIPLYFKPNKDFTANQNLFRSIKPDTLDTMDLSGDLNINTETPSMFDHLTSLRALNLNDTGIGDATIAAISKLTKLTVLKIDKTDITGDGLIKLKQLPALTDLELGLQFRLDRLLAKLADGSKLNSLKIHGTSVAKDELSMIARITTLKHLILDDTHTVDRDLLALKALPALEIIELRNLLYDPSISSTLITLPALKQVVINTSQWSAADKAAFKETLKNVQISEVTN